jgi:hypothetical protein
MASNAAAHERGEIYRRPGDWDHFVTHGHLEHYKVTKEQLLQIHEYLNSLTPPSAAAAAESDVDYYHKLVMQMPKESLPPCLQAALDSNSPLLVQPICGSCD